MALPVVDFSLLTLGTDAQRSLSAKQLVDSLEIHGFVRLRNHGLSSDTIRALFTWVSEMCIKTSTLALQSWPWVFDATESKVLRAPHRLEKKDRVPREISTFAWVRWSRPREHFKNLTRLDCCGGRQRCPSEFSLCYTMTVRDWVRLQESLDYGSPLDADFPNVWLDEADLPGFRQGIESCYVAYQTRSFQIMQALESGLKIPSGCFTERCIPDSSELRLNHYPEVNMQELNSGRTRRIWPHTDTGLISLLLQDRVGGLELEDRQNPGAFLPASSEDPTDMIVNVGDTLERWTNGVLKAALHHVSTPDNMKNKENGRVTARSSIVFFLRANGATSAGPIPCFVTPKRPTGDSETTVLEYLQQSNSKLFGYWQYSDYQWPDGTNKEQGGLVPQRY